MVERLPHNLRALRCRSYVHGRIITRTERCVSRRRPLSSPPRPSPDRLMKGAPHMVTSIAPSFHPNRHPMEGDLEELRGQALRKVALGAIVTAFALLSAALTIPSLVGPRLLLLAAVLSVSALAAWWTSRRWYWPSTIFLIAGLLAATAIAEVVYALPQVLFALPLVVFVAPLLVGQW